MNLLDVQRNRIDLRHSEWDEEASKPHEGYFKWRKKECINYHAPDRPPYFFSWIRYDAGNGYREYMNARVTMRYEPVRAPTKPGQKAGVDYDPYVPEGAEIRSDGFWHFGDVIWCKCPLINEIRRLKENEELSSHQRGSKLKGFENQVGAEGSKLPQEIIDRLNAPPTSA